MSTTLQDPPVVSGHSPSSQTTFLEMVTWPRHSFLHCRITHLVLIIINFVFIVLLKVYLLLYLINVVFNDNIMH